MLTAPIAVAVLCLTTNRASLRSADGPSPPAQHGSVTPAAPGEDVLQMMKDGRPRFELLDSDGTRHRARLVRIDGDNVVLQSGAELFSMPADQFQRSHRRGDSPWDGALVGLSVGVGMWALVEQSDPGASVRWKSDNPNDWTVKDTVSLLCFSTTVGYIIDAIHVGRHTVFVGPMDARTRQRAALTMGVSGRAHERQLQLAYRVSF